MFLFGAGLLLEFSLYGLPVLWRRRAMIAGLDILLISAWVGSSMPIYGWPIIAAVFIALMRMLNLLRIIESRLQEKYLYDATRRTTISLALLQLLAVILLRFGVILTEGQILFMAMLQVITALLIFGVTAKNLYKTAYRPSPEPIADRDLPSVTVAIPARNETADLSSCLQAIIANDYPKLEILVLDDCSQDRTAEIIKDFAQDGVRFLPGAEPKEGWLSKNQAYESLARHASGELILFCGVDVRFGPGAIRSLVTSMLSKNRSMLSVMPLRVGGGVRTAFIQPMRYWWEIALPRRLFNRPPVLSTCWMIHRQTLKKLGGFAAVSNTMIPEGYFARELVKTDSYMFMRASETFDVRMVKSVEEQLQTAIRMRYAQLRKRPENVFMLSFFETFFLLMPFLIALSGFWVGFNLLQWLGIATSGLLISTHYLIMASSNPANSVVALINFPLVIITEIFMVYWSMYKYEFSVVEWKGRNICIPVLQITPKLPVITED